MGNEVDLPVSPENVAEEEPDTTNDLVERTVRQLAITDEMKLVLVDVVERELGRGALVVGDQTAHGTQIRIAGLGSTSSNAKFTIHQVTESSHG
jgi:hypothetical protein